MQMKENKDLEKSQIREKRIQMKDKIKKDFKKKKKIYRKENAIER